ncbi:hypothetical protein IC582_021766 [Cucumis melo]
MWMTKLQQYVVPLHQSTPTENPSFLMLPSLVLVYFDENMATYTLSLRL